MNSVRMNTLHRVKSFCRFLNACECPHRLLDRLLKSNPLGAVAIGSGLRILRFPAAASRGIYHLFSPVVERTREPFSSTLSRLSRCRCAVSVGAHYREPKHLRKGFFPHQAPSEHLFITLFINRTPNLKFVQKTALSLFKNESKGHFLGISLV